MDAWVALALIVGFLLLVGFVLFLVLTRAFRDMGLSTAEAVVIIVGSFLLGQGILDDVVGVPFSNLPLMTYGSWRVGVNLGGAVVPLLLCLYLIWKLRLSWRRLLFGILLVGVVAYLVTVPDPARGIVSRFPWWLLPVVVASLCSVVLLWGQRRKAAPFAYIIGVCGVLLGADLLHLYTLLNTAIPAPRTAVIGGASVFDMVFTTGLLAVLLDGIMGYRKSDESGAQKKGSGD